MGLLVPILIGLWGAVPILLAEDEPAKLVEMRSTYHKGQLELRLPIARDYLQRLQILQDRLVKSEELEAAIEVRDEKDSVRKWIEGAGFKVGTQSLVESDISQKETMVSLRKAYADAVELDMGGLQLHYLVALEKLQKSMVEDANLEGALAVETERELVKSGDAAANKPLGKPVPKPAPNKGPHVLTAAVASLSGGARLDPKKGLIVGLERRGAQVKWDLQEVAAGAYEVTLSYYSGRSGGNFDLRSKQDFGRLALVGSGNVGKVRSYSLGIVTFDTNDHVTLTTRYSEKSGQILIKSITLTPTAGSKKSGKGAQSKRTKSGVY